jgi:hypothetical protein
MSNAGGSRADCVVNITACVHVADLFTCSDTHLLSPGAPGNWYHSRTANGGALLHVPLCAVVATPAEETEQAATAG